MPATKRAAKPAAQNRSRMQSPKRGTTSVKKASDRSRLQAPKSAASRARGMTAIMERMRPKGRADQMKKKVTSAFKNMKGSERLADPLNRLRPSASRRSRLAEAIEARKRQGRSRLRQS